MTLNWAIGLLGAAGALLFLWAGLRVRHQRNQLATVGADGEGQIVHKDRLSGRSTTFYVHIQYMATGEATKAGPYKEPVEISEVHFHALAEGQTVAIRYLPTNPRVVRLAGEYADNAETTSYFAYGGGCLVVAILIVVAGLGAAQSGPTVSPTPDIVATEGGDLAAVQTALTSHIAEWETISDQGTHHFSPEQAGIAQLGITDIVYGRCSDGTFYLFAPKTFQTGRTPAIHVADAYAYMTKPDDALCWPLGWLMTSQGNFGDGWFWATVVIIDRTPTPILAEREGSAVETLIG